jgi:hypothetical protein
MAKTVFRQQRAVRAVGLEPSWAVQAGTRKVCRTELVRDGYSGAVLNAPLRVFVPELCSVRWVLPLFSY